MKNGLIMLLVVLAAGALSYGVFYTMNDAPAVRQAAREGDAMAWLRAEFHLTAAQFAAIKKLHDDYGLQCSEHCRAIMDARRRGASRAEQAALEKICVDAMTEHFRKVAALMSPGEGDRYLAIVLPRVGDYGHQGAPTVQVRS
jgi:hypothetical protein